MSSSKTILSVRNLKKSYKIFDAQENRYKQFLVNQFSWLLPKKYKNKKYFRDFTALNDINFKLKVNETLGIVGMNGSGKSTLLQIITGNSFPTKGQVDHSCKIGALLELGSGFNNEFNGIENIYINTAIHGLSKKETENIIQLIIDFADIGDYINQPIKFYSSGMVVRLAFSIIVHIDAKLLIIDEALSVGDTAFQAKCFKKLADLKKEGVSFILVSHDLNILKSMCDNVLWLENGIVKEYGQKKDILDNYIKSQHLKINTLFSGDKTFNENKTYGNKLVTISKLRICDEHGNKLKVLTNGSNYRVIFEVCFQKNFDNISIGYFFKNEGSQPIIGMHSSNYKKYYFSASKGKIYEVVIDFKNILNKGIYRLQVQIEKIQNRNINHEFLLVDENAYSIESIQKSSNYGIFHALVETETSFKFYEK